MLYIYITAAFRYNQPYQIESMKIPPINSGGNWTLIHFIFPLCIGIPLKCMH